MTPMTWENYQVGVPKTKKLKLVMNSDNYEYGGNGHSVPEELIPVKEDYHYKEYSVKFDLPPYTAVVYTF